MIEYDVREAPLPGECADDFDLRAGDVHGFPALPGELRSVAPVRVRTEKEDLFRRGGPCLHQLLCRYAGHKAPQLGGGVRVRPGRKCSGDPRQHAVSGTDRIHRGEDQKTRDFVKALPVEKNAPLVPPHHKQGGSPPEEKLPADLLHLFRFRVVRGAQLVPGDPRRFAKPELPARGTVLFGKMPGIRYERLPGIVPRQQAQGLPDFLCVYPVRHLLFQNDDIEPGERAREVLQQPNGRLRMEPVEAPEVKPLTLLLFFEGLHVDVRVPVLALDEKPRCVDPGRAEYLLHLIAERVRADDPVESDALHPHRLQVAGNVAGPSGGVPL